MGSAAEDVGWNAGPFLLIAALFLTGTGFGLAGLVLAARRRARSRFLAWLAVGSATACVFAGLSSMLLATSRPLDAAEIGRGSSFSRLEARQTSANTEGRTSLAAGVFLGLIPFGTGALVLSRTRRRGKGARV